MGNNKNNNHNILNRKITIFILIATLSPIGEAHRKSILKWEYFYLDDTTPSPNNVNVLNANQSSKGTMPAGSPNEVAADEPACGPEHTKNWFIYCQGPILEAVNWHKLYNDSKDFVDSPMRKSPNETLRAFKAQFGDGKSVNVRALDADALRQFIGDNFDPPGSELSKCVPADWKEKPQKLMAIQDENLREWALELNGIWRKLCKKINPQIAKEIDRFSLLYVPNEFIAPGGRFREFYYWDAYWIIRGLIASEMYGSAKKMIQNLAHMVKSFGMVPNGGRVYYLRRSQPPLFGPMMFEYFMQTWDLDFLKEMLPIMEMEIQFWDANRRTQIYVEQQNVTYSAYLYRANSNGPRPESFKEDMAHAEAIDDPKERPFFFKSVASAAESGWDFSSRWFRDPFRLSTIETVNILPVDLNAFICWNFKMLDNLYSTIGKYGRARHYRNRRYEMQDLLEAVFYNETEGVWFDFNVRTGRQNTHFYPSVAMPLFTGCYSQIDERRSQRVFDYMKGIGVFDYAGGIPTSMVNGTGEQWDFPNGWSPLNHIVIEGLRKSQNAQMEEQAFQLAKKWIFANFKVYRETKQMWEKYNVIGNAEPGHGGEYEVQDGFGWTNGVILDLLVAYQDRLIWPVPPAPSQNGNTIPSSSFPAALALAFATFAIIYQRLFLLMKCL